LYFGPFTFISTLPHENYELGDNKTGKRLVRHIDHLKGMPFTEQHWTAIQKPARVKHRSPTNKHTPHDPNLDDDDGTPGLPPPHAAGQDE
jgi:hypothetical protein